MKYLNVYNEIIEKYRKGEYGKQNLSLHDILDKANNPDLIDRLDLSEIQGLLDSASGITKKMFYMLKQKTESKIVHMAALEEELKNFDIDAYRDSKDGSDEALAKNLKLVVEYCSKGELPADTEAMLCPVKDSVHLGVIKIQKDCAITSFSFRHELIHYFRDVKVGHKVTVELARKIKGKTPNNGEQEVNYLTAASIMPLEEIRTKLDEFEAIVSQDKEKTFLLGLAKKYEQDEGAILRRIIEVRRLIDYMYSSKK